MVAGDALRIVVIMGIGKGIRQIMGELAQGIVMPEIPFLPAPEPLDPGIQKGMAVGIMVSLENMAPEGASQVSKGIAVRLEGAKEKGGLIAPGRKSAAAVQ
jgi:hypothetical protein